MATFDGLMGNADLSALTQKQRYWLLGGSLGAAALLYFVSSGDAGSAVDTVEQAGSSVMNFGTQFLTAITDGPTFAKKVWDELSARFPDMSTVTKLIIIAHGAYESGWGQKAAIKQGAANNIFNITAGSVPSTTYWDGQRLTVKNADRRYAAKGAAQPDASWLWDANFGQWYQLIDQVWRVYPDYGTALQDYYDFLGPSQNGGRYVTARAALDAGDVTGFATELGLHGYYDKNIIDTYTAQLAKVVNTAKSYLAM